MLDTAIENVFILFMDITSRFFFKVKEFLKGLSLLVLLVDADEESKYLTSSMPFDFGVQFKLIKRNKTKKNRISIKI